jgi:hypothetical protein
VKRSLIYLVAIMFLLTAAVAFAGDAAKTESGGCPMMKAKTAADTAAAANSHAGCPYAKGEAKASGAAATTTGETKSTSECPMHAKAPIGKAEASASNAVTAVSAPATESKIENTGNTAAEVEKISVKVPEGSCPDVVGKNELTNFHNNMHPMDMALKAGNYAEIKSSMPKLMEASKGVAAYKCPMTGKCSPECLKAFDDKKTTLLKAVDELNLACQGDDNKKIDATFGTMHQAYIDFAGMCNPSAKETAKKVESK